MLYIPVFAYMFNWVSKKTTIISMNWVVTLSLLCIPIIVYILWTPVFFDVQYVTLVEHKISMLHFIAHWISAIFIGLLFYHVIQVIKEHLPVGAIKAASWLIAGAIVLFLSLELSVACNAVFYSSHYPLERITTVYVKTGLPILWGLSSFALMWLGMRNKVSTLRIISLTLFSINLIKLFVFDIRNIPPAGKIAAFFCLGVLLLIISFMYQKVKKIIVQDEVTKENEA